MVNYAQYYLSLNSISCNEGNPCQLLSFNIDGQADAIPYREVDGQRHVLDREIKLIYNTLEWDDSTTCWDDKVVVESFEYLDDNIQITQPLCDTEFTLTGDRFLRYWNLEEQSITSEYYNTQAVSVHTTAIQEIRNNDNEQGQNNNGENSQGRAFSGSAPIHIVFTGYPSDENLWGVWEMATDAEFEDIIRTDYQNELDITFEDYGTYYLRYRIEGVCEVTDEPYTVTVDAPDIKCSNVFAPHGNDMWKVNYESLIDFHCWIFNRWGNLVFEYTDPGSGWDGKYRGSLVDAGVYYYVITYTGSDRVRKTKRGDITVLRPKKGVSGSSSGTGTTEGDIGDSVE